MLRIATRRSALARAQAFQTGQLLQVRTGEPFELVPLATTGDLHPDRAVGDFDTKGLFVDAIRAAVLDGDCDVAVHSFKDLPSDPVDGLVVAAVPPREDPRDVLVSRDGAVLSTLADTATVGTSSQRRRLQLLRARPGLSVLPLRGNLDTRLRRVADGELDAVVVAFAGLRRLYRPEAEGGVGALGLPLTAAPLEPGECLPAADEVDGAVRRRRAAEGDLRRAAQWATSPASRVLAPAPPRRRRTVAIDSRIAAPPASTTRAASSRPTASGAARGPRWDWRSTRRWIGSASAPASSSTCGSTSVASAPTGARQPPPSASRKARSARTAAWV
ncbi:MAG TPA: hydroxymethylbilane synthase, partial [Egibacteraceae bacterium]